MTFVDLVFNELALAKLARRGIAPEELRQALDNGALLTRNPHARVPGSRLLIGPSDGSRMVTAVVQPDGLHASLLHVMTGWPSSRREIVHFRTRR